MKDLTTVPWKLSRSYSVFLSSRLSKEKILTPVEKPNAVDTIFKECLEQRRKNGTLKKQL